MPSSVDSRKQDGWAIRGVRDAPTRALHQIMSLFLLGQKLGRAPPRGRIPSPKSVKATNRPSTERCTPPLCSTLHPEQ